jgi:hypothetical protein
MKRTILIFFGLFYCSINLIFGQIEIVLRKSFIDSFKRRVTIETNYLIAKAHASPNSPSKDGDLHFSGTAAAIGLPIVAEIMNAKRENDAVGIVHDKEGTSDSVKLQGVWRIWCEHAGSDTRQEQGGTFPPITGTNPDHIFEIHPVTNINNVNLLRSLKPITGFTYKKAEDAFFRYSNARCRIIPDGDRIIIETNGVGFNYVEFWIELIDNDQLEVEDGRFVFCKVLDKSKEIISQKMRMVFPKDSPAEQKVKNLQAGDRMHVVGMPRLNFSLLSFRVEHSTENPDMLEWNLPVEMIIVAAFRR